MLPTFIGAPARPRATAASGVTIVVIAALLGACGSSAKPNAAGKGSTAAANVTKVGVALTPGGCAPQPPSISAGKTEFTVMNQNATAVSEAELKSADRAHILGEKQNLAPGRSGSFTLTLRAGSYQVVCPGAQQSSWDLRVTGANAGNDWHDNPELVAAVNGYGVWVRQEVAQLATRTQAFVAAVNAGQIDNAKVLYARARVDYESVEPVAEAFGDLDKEIDGRIDDFPNPANFEGFHRLERALFTDKNLAGMTPIANRLEQHVNQLHQLVKTQQYSPIELASGATDLVNEIEETKITGEEERYSGIDLVDFRGNLSGAMELVHEFTPFLSKNDPSLLTTINARNQVVETALARYASTPGYDGSGYVDYDTVTTAERRELSQVINGLAEAISEMVVVVSR